ncbi:MAG TPA: hypothetical protein VFZ24_06130 [Longimicrobiales bacterium]
MTREAGRIARIALVFALVPGLWACEPAETEVDTQPGEEVTVEGLRVTEVDLGNAIGPDRRITDDRATDDFRPNETIYAVVETEGAATGSTLTARWTFEDGQVVDETTQTISPTGPAVTEFHISKPDGFPVGSYQVEILLNGSSVERKDFEVKQ